MIQWVKLCSLSEAPATDAVMEVETAEGSICLANVNGELAALDNICPHRLGPLGQGWVDGNSVVCPWHCWAFDVKSGEAAWPDKGRIEVFPIRIEGDSILAALPEREPAAAQCASEENF